MNKYYIYKDGEQVGPLSVEQLKSYGLSAETPMWHEGLADWKHVRDFPEVLAVLSSGNTDMAERKPGMNGMIYANIGIQLFTTFAFYLSREEYGDGPLLSIFMGVFCVAILLNVVSIILLLNRNYRAAKVVSIIACIPFIPLGAVGIVGINKAIETATGR